MFSLRYRRARKHLRYLLKPAIAFEFWSTLVFMVSFSPASGWLLNRLVAASGQYAVTDNDLLAFFLSTQGILFLVLSVGFVLTFWFAEQVGLLVIAGNAVFKKQVSVSRVLWEQITRLPALVRLGLIQAAIYLAAGVPFLLGIGLTYRLLLWEWDLYYYINVKPTEWWIAVAIAGSIAAAYFVLAVWLYIRWFFSIPVLIFEGTAPLDALRKSWRQTRGRFWEFVVTLLIWWVVVIASSFVVTWLIRTVSAAVLDHIGFSLKFVVPVVIGTLALIAVLDALWFIVGKITHILLITDFYLEVSNGEKQPSAPAQTTARLSPIGLKRIGWIVAGIALVLGVISVAAFIQGFNISRAVELTGHRGSKLRAPENTMSALRQAIAEGADYAEIDVQTTADGVVVLLHDADLMRVASVGRRLRDVNFEDLGGIDVGSWFAPEFSTERIPTLQQAIDLARGRIKLNIELKFTWPDPALAEKVADIVRRNQFASQCVVSSLNFQALSEVKKAFPELKTGFIVLQAIGNLSRMEADFLSISAASATPRMVRAVHNRGMKIHVWTVNDLNSALSMIEMGVDNIITDEPAQIRALLEAWLALSDSEKIVLMLRNLIVGIESPEPAAL